jgi:CRP-like cAMP-binding protein
MRQPKEPPVLSLEEIFRMASPISDDALELLRDKVSTITFKKGDLLIEEGKLNEDMYLIRSGIYRNFAMDDGEEDTRWFAYAGDVVASMFCVVQHLPAIASVDALTDGEAYILPGSVVQELIEKSHEWAKWISQYLFDGLYVFERRYTFLGRGDAYTRYNNFLKMRPEWMVNQIPLKYIASYLNITPQTLSVIRRRTTLCKVKTS